MRMRMHVLAEGIVVEEQNLSPHLLVSQVDTHSCVMTKSTTMIMSQKATDIFIASDAAEQGGEGWWWIYLNHMRA